MLFVVWNPRQVGCNPPSFGYGPRNFEPWSSHENAPELPHPSPNYPTSPTGGHLSFRQIYRASLPYTMGLQRN
ncbi:hypothetical protein TNCV_2754821 [Trichonephila clavipes]|nr:hypothetical protein TNCV_2754821 [Trichonephila clavipes]